jgi:hypothetical protein
MPRFHRTRKFITVSPTAHHRTVHWTRQTNSTASDPIFLSILLLPSHLHLGLPCGLFPLVFRAKFLKTFLTCPVRGTCPAHVIVLHVMTTCYVFCEQCAREEERINGWFYPSVRMSQLGNQDNHGNVKLGLARQCLVRLGWARLG